MHSLFLAHVDRYMIYLIVFSKSYINCAIGLALSYLKHKGVWILQGYRNIKREADDFLSYEMVKKNVRTIFKVKRDDKQSIENEE